MTRRRRALVLIASFVLALGVSAALVHAARERIRELWFIHQLGSEDPAARRAAIPGLADAGRDPAAVAVLAVAKEWKDLRGEALQALAAIGPRCSEKGKAALLRGLLSFEDLNPTDRANEVELVDAALAATARSSPQSLPVLHEGLLAESRATPQGAIQLERAARALAAACEAFPDEGVDLFRKSSLEAVQAFLRHQGLRRDLAALRAKGMLIQGPDGSSGAAAPLDGGARAIAEDLLAASTDERFRALALTFLIIVFADGEGGATAFDGRRLAAAFAVDPSPLVRTAALRLTGVIGNLSGGLDLTRLLLDTEEPELLVDVIQARTLWAAFGTFAAFELWDGFVCDWLPRQNRKRVGWEKEEVARLERLLATRKEPRLRDAASLALASDWRTVEGRIVDFVRLPERIPGFRVHEWGVWSDAAGTLISPAQALAELPEFVHRSEVSAAAFLRERAASSMVAFKPVLFFHAPEPLSLLVQVGFHEGRPWSYYPRATDYRLETRSSGRSFTATGPTPTRPPRAAWDPPRLSSLAPAEGTAASGGADPFARKGFEPPWLEPSRQARPRGEAVAIPRDLYRLVPWLGTRPDTLGGQRWFSGSTEPAGIGLEWCGLRVGHDPALEAPLPEAAPGSWWSWLREAGGATVAVRGEAERFLFHDGSVRMPSPLLVAWSDADQLAVLFRVRPFGEYPEWPSRTDPLTGPLPAVFVVQAGEGGALAGTVLRDLASSPEVYAIRLADLDLRGRALEAAFLEALVHEGLTAAEAEALRRTWEKEFFRAPGTRVLAVLPRWMYDTALPLRVLPVPEDLTRVGVVWTELEEAADSGLAKVSGRSWEARPWPMPLGDFPLTSYPWEPGETKALEINQDGDLVLDGFLLASSSRGGELACFTAIAGSSFQVLLADPGKRELQVLDRLEWTERHRHASLTMAAGGNAVAYSWREEGLWRGRLIDRERRLLFTLENRSPLSFSADGQQLLFEYEWSDGVRLAVLDRALSKSRTLLWADGGDHTEVHEASLSGDGRRVALACEVNGVREVYLLDLEAETLLNVSQAKGDDEPSLSHDGSRILFESERDRDAEIYLADIERKQIWNVTRRGGQDRFPALSADGKYAAYHQEGEAGTVILDLESGEKRLVTDAKRRWNSWVATDRKAVLLWRQEGDQRVIRVRPFTAK